MRNLLRASLAVLLVLFSLEALAASGPDTGFVDHGVAAPISFSRGTVATVNGDGHDIVLIWLFDYRGGYALLGIDIETGQTREYPMPFPPGNDTPYASILSSRNRYYTHFNSRFVEFDPRTQAFTFVHETAPEVAMSMTEDDRGFIWSVTYPQCGVVSYDPETGRFRDYGHVYKQDWPQYPSHVATDDKGWIYFSVGPTASQIIAFDPVTGEATPMLSDAERRKGSGLVYRDMDGKVYGKALETDNGLWYRFYEGKSSRMVRHAPPLPKPIVAGGWGLFHQSFPDGKRIATLDLEARKLVIEDPKRKDFKKEIAFQYSTEGAYVMSLAASPEGGIWGGTSFPMRAFSYVPETYAATSREAYNQWNALAAQGKKLFVGGYPGGFLLEWDPSKPWIPTVKNKPGNPDFLTEGTPIINRPTKVLAFPDNRTIVLAGTPEYGFTGGGLLFWDRETRKSQVLKDTDIIPDHSTASLVALPGRRLLGGTTTSAGTGGLKKASVAQLYLMDVDSKELLWHEAILPGVQEYNDLYLTRGGLVYGIADRHLFFVFDVNARRVVARRPLDKFGATAYQQGPRIFIGSPDGKVYVLFLKGIARVNPKDHTIVWMADSPVPITAGGDYLDGRIYFGSGSHIYSYNVEK